MPQSCLPEPTLVFKDAWKKSSKGLQLSSTSLEAADSSNSSMSAMLLKQC